MHRNVEPDISIVVSERAQTVDRRRRNEGSGDGGDDGGLSAPGESAEALRPTLADEAYQELKRRIVMIEFEPGAQFREADIAASLGLGKTPVREALLRLRLEGLVRVQSRSGYSVSPVTLKSARSVCELRALLEGEAAHRAAFATGGALEDLLAVEEAGRRTLVALDLATLSRDRETLTTWLDTERAFHLALAHASGNELLAEVLSGVLEGFARLCYLASALGPREALPVADHQDLVSAISSGHAAEAQSLVAGEIRATENWLIQALLRSESLSTTNVDATPGARPHNFYLDVPTDRRGQGG